MSFCIAFFVGAGYQNRTGAMTLARSRTATILIPRSLNISYVIPINKIYSMRGYKESNPDQRFWRPLFYH